MNIRVCRDFSELESFREEWNALLLKSTRQRIFLTYDWIAAWWKIYSEGKDLCTILIHDNNDLVGIAPLYIEICTMPIGITFRQICILGDNKVGGDFLDLILDPDRADEIRKIIFETLCKSFTFDRICFRGLPADSPTLLGSSVRINGISLHPCICKAFPCPHIPLPATMEELIDQPNRTFKRSVRRMTRKLYRQRSVDFLVAKTEEDVETYLDRLFDLHQEHWESRDETGSFAFPKKREFYRTVSSAILEKGWLYLTALRVDGEILAVTYGMHFGERYTLLQTGCGLEGRKLRAGSVLTYRTIESLIDKVRHFDFLRGGESYKYQWGAVDAYTLNHCLWAGKKGCVLAWISQMLRKLKDAGKRLKKAVLSARSRRKE